MYSAHKVLALSTYPRQNSLILPVFFSLMRQDTSYIVVISKVKRTVRRALGSFASSELRMYKLSVEGFDVVSFRGTRSFQLGNRVS